MSDPAANVPAGAVAVVGMAGRFPGAASVGALWENLIAGVESIAAFSDDELRRAGVAEALLARPDYVKARAVLDAVDLFDADLFGFTPREAEITAPAHRLLLECAWEALEHAGYGGERSARVGIFAGTGINLYLLRNLMSNLDLVGALGALQTGIGNGHDHLTTRISYELDLKGPSVDVQTACSTSLVAVHLACQSLLDGESDLALAGGVSVYLPQVSGYVHQEGGIGSPDGHCRPFDARAGGTVGGSGVGIVVLERLEDALARRDPIEAVILGSAINNDGAGKVGYTAPSVEGQAEVISEALAVAGIDPASIGYVEAHGTATELGDPIEMSALRKAFGSGDGAGAPGSCLVGSVKSNLGHLDAAAGVTGLIKAVLALRHGLIPPSLHFESPNPDLHLEASPFAVADRLLPWEAPPGAPRRAGVSSFGIGGTNAHAVLEEAPVPAPDDRPPPAPEHLLVISAATASALERRTEDLAECLAAQPGLRLDDVAFTLQVGRAALPWRRIAVAGDAVGAAAVLTRRDPKLCATGRAEARGRFPVFLFPGQGAQRPGMGRGLYDAEPVFRDTVDRCAEVLAPGLDLDLRELLFPAAGEEEEEARRLDETRLAQPALFVVELALARLWEQRGVRPKAMLGHSLGELTAACLAGVFSEDDALRVVAARGRLMQEADRGAMLGVEMAVDELSPELPDVLSVAALNAPENTVVSGPEEAIRELEGRLEGRGVRCRLLRTSHAFHSASMDGAAERFAELVAEVGPRPPEIPFLSNVTGTWIRPEEAADPAYWGRHLRQPVRFSDGLGEVLGRAGAFLLEMGPGQTLSALVRLHDAAEQVTVVPCTAHPRSGASDAAAFLHAVGRYWVAGGDVDWRTGHEAEDRRRLRLPTYPFERRRHWVDEVPRSKADAPALPAPAPPAVAPEPTPAPPPGWADVFERQLQLMAQQLEILAAAPAATREAEVPLSPIQRWYLDAGPAAPESFVQAQLLTVPAGLDDGLLEPAIAAVAAHHPAFDLRFHRTPQGWRQVAGDPVPPAYRRVDVSRLPAAERERALRAEASAERERFDLQAGPLLRAVRFGAGSGPDRLLVLAHHLVVDYYSWRILVGDLRQAVSELERGEPVRLTPASLPFAEWSRRLERFATSAELRRQVPYWTGERFRAGRPLPAGDDAVATMRDSAGEGQELVVARLEEPTARRLVRELPRRLGTGAFTVVLAALAAGLEKLAGGPVTLHLESHGREPLFPDADLARSVGWFTTVYPFQAGPLADATPEEAVARVARELARVPAGGVGYGLLRFLGSDPEVVERLTALPEPPVLFDWVGVGGPPAGDEAAEPFAPAPESLDDPAEAGPALRHPLEVTAGVIDGRLEVRLRHDPRLLGASAVERLAAELTGRLRALAGDDAGPPPYLAVPATEAQQGLWAVCRLGGEAAYAYNESLALRLRGSLSAPALAASLAALAQRHEAFRTAFADRGDEQRILFETVLPLREVDLSALGEAALPSALATCDRRPFDLATAPLARAALLKLGPRDHVVSLVVHHAVSDAWSFGVLVRELEALYRAGRAGEPCALPAAQRFSRHARREVHRLQGSQAAAAEAWWLEELTPPLHPLELPIDRPRPPIQTFRGGSLGTVIDGEAYETLRGAATEAGVTVFVYLLAAFGAHLHLLSGQRDLVFGFHSAGQAVTGADALVGYCIRMLPLRSRLVAGQRFSEYLRRAQSKAAGALEHQDYPFARLVRRLGLRRDPGRPPLISVVFNLERGGQGGPARFADLEVEGLDRPASFARFDQLWDLRDRGSDLVVDVTFNADLFDRSTVEASLRRFVTWAGLAAAAPDRRLEELGEELAEREREHREERQRALQAQRRSRLARPARKAIPVETGRDV